MISDSIEKLLKILEEGSRAYVAMAAKMSSVFGVRSSVRRERVKSTVNSMIAAGRVQKFIEDKGTRLNFLAMILKVNVRTLRRFLTTGKIRKDTFEDIARWMKTTPEELLKPE